jgi:hypothetical protein
MCFRFRAKTRLALLVFPSFVRMRFYTREETANMGFYAQSAPGKKPLKTLEYFPQSGRLIY